MAGFRRMHNDGFLALANPTALVASDDKIACVGEVMVLLLQLSAELLSILEDVVALEPVPCRHIERIIYLVFREDLGDAVIVDV